MAIGQSPVIQDLQEYIKDIRVRLLNLIQQDHRVWPTAHCLRQVTAFFIAHVPRGCTDKTSDRVFFHELGHVNPDHRFFGIE